MLPTALERSKQAKVLPDDLTSGFKRLGLRDGHSIEMHASLEALGVVEGGAAMVLHRLLGVIGKSGTLLMPAFTSITRHGTTHNNFTRPGCWCEGKEDRHLPFIPELQPDKNIGAIAHRLCSWPGSRRSKHPAYSFVAVGRHSDELVSGYETADPLLPIKKLMKYNPLVLTIGVGFEMVSAIHLAEEKKLRSKFVKERALVVTSKGMSWVDIVALGCSGGFHKMKEHLDGIEIKESEIGLAPVRLHPMKKLVERARSLIEHDEKALACNNLACLSCGLIRGRPTGI